MSLWKSLTTTTHKSKKRLGQGYGSGKGGHTSSRGQKGQKSRQGKVIPLWFEGGQLPMIKKYPMIRGKSRFKVLEPTAEITLTDVQKMSAEVISLDTLKLEKVIDPRFKKAKIIMGGEITRKVTIQSIKVSQAAKAAIEKAGGLVE